jgi:hypothetical protein
MSVKMRRTDSLKKSLRWLWPSLCIMVLSCIRKSILTSLPFEQTQEGLFLYTGYVLVTIPAGIFLSKLKLFDDESKVSLILLCVTYVFFEYSGIYSTWEHFTRLGMIPFLRHAKHAVFMLIAAFFIVGMMWVLGFLNQKEKNLKILLFTTFVLSVAPFIDVLRAPGYKFNSDLFTIQHIDSVVNQAGIPKRIFWIILDERPSSLVLNELWGYKDTTFRNGLESLGFTVYDSCISNYNFSPFSIASTTYGAMLPIAGRQDLSHEQWFILGDRIRHSPVINFLRKQEYKTCILSFMGSETKKIYFADEGEIVTYHGAIVRSSVLDVLLSQFENRRAVSLGFYNWEIIDSVHSLLNPISKNDQRIFVYAHLIMPHGPYIPLENKITERKGILYELKDDQAFLSHVKYTDSTILDLFHKGLDGMSADQRSNTLIILQADHGPRFLEYGGKDLRWRSSFGILNAVLWPKNSKGKFYHGMSSVNTFRILLRDVWGINLRTLKDSSANVSPLVIEHD